MCRHLAYLGPPVSLAALLCEPTHSLLRQSWAPADMRGGGTINADGFGAGWYTPGQAQPARYRTDRPMWTDASFAAVAAATRSGAVLAAVRAASPGMPVTSTACAPFAGGDWLFSHNGVVAGWPASVAGLAGELPMTDLLTLDAPTDSALLWALLRRRLVAGDEPAEAVSEVIAAVSSSAPGSRLNLLLTDGTQVVATAWAHALSVRAEPDAVTVASEPTDELPGWSAVPDGHLLTAVPGWVSTRPLWPRGTGAR